MDAVDGKEIKLLPKCHEVRNAGVASTGVDVANHPRAVGRSIRAPQLCSKTAVVADEVGGSIKFPKEPDAECRGPFDRSSSGLRSIADPEPARDGEKQLVAGPDRGAEARTRSWVRVDVLDSM